MLDDRRLFITLAEAGSLAQTARLLNVSRSTVMRRLNALEDTLGLTLVHRAGRRIALTDTGRRYADSLRPIFESLDRVEQELHEADGQLRGRLRLALPFLGASRFLTPAFARFHRAHAGVVLNIELARDVRHLEVGTFDVALQYGTRSNPDLVAQQLYREQLILCASSAYAAAAGAPQTLAELQGHRVIMQQDLDGRLVPWRLPDGERVAAPSASAVTNSVVVAYELMLEGMGIARVPRLLAADALESGAAVHVLPEVLTEAPVLFVYANDPNPVTRAFLDFMLRARWSTAPASQSGPADAPRSDAP
ncbi:MAG: LysR family transcriptional regulator [Proteobacteria bacterium]|nr:LysR family transcriptional regulator [Pseudomonadota bacterium]